MTNEKRYINKTVLCIDFGTKNIGLSLFKIGQDPFPLPFDQIVNKSSKHSIKTIQQIVNDEFVDLIILGLPLHKDGKDSEMTKKVRDFKAELFTELQIEIQYQHEYLTSFEAENRMKASARYNFKIDKNQVDSLAASIILEEWLQNTPETSST